MENGPSPLEPLVPCRGMGAGIRGTDRRPGQQISDARQHHRSRAPAGGERKRGAKDQALGRSRGGLTTRIHMLADTLGRPLLFIVTAGQEGDVTQAPALLKGQEGHAVLADKAYDNSALRAIIAQIGAEAVIPSNCTRKITIPPDAIACKKHNRIEQCFNRLKQFRRVATRYERRTVHFSGFVFLASAMLGLR